MYRWPEFHLRTLFILSVQNLLFCFGCTSESMKPDRLENSEPLNGAACNFDIYWPPRDPQENQATTGQPLLHGKVALKEHAATNGGSEVQLLVTITRPSEEADRQFWNKQLAYADLSWMDEVRVWDADSKWLWPNLPFLLRRPGLERIERYGGVDPGKHVDNDFAAILIRKYDASGKIEATETKDSPLVSAEWRADGLTETDLHTVVHVAKSDSFIMHLGGNDQPERGKIKLWLIYADFLGARPPRTWPQEREWAGGILAYIEIDWETIPGQPCHAIMRHKRPEESTGFQWIRWTETPGSPARAHRNDNSG